MKIKWLSYLFCVLSRLASMFSMKSLLPENREFWRFVVITLILFEPRHAHAPRDGLRRVHLLHHLAFGHFIDDAHKLCSLRHYMKRVVIRQDLEQPEKNKIN